MLSIKEIDEHSRKASGANLNASMTANISPAAIWVSRGHKAAKKDGVASHTTPTLALLFATMAHILMEGPLGPGSKEESVQHLASDFKDGTSG